MQPLSARDKAHAIRSALSHGVRAVSAPSLFQTPGTLARRMVELADIEPGHRVLEPSAGMGRIASAIVTGSQRSLLYIEINSQLAAGLEDAGYPTICTDFLMVTPEETGQFDRVIMNPPFERSKDCLHVRHAFNFLRPGGRIVAIMGEGAFFRRQDAGFREWLDMHGTSEKLPAGTFHESGTDVNARLVTLARMGEDKA